MSSGGCNAVASTREKGAVRAVEWFLAIGRRRADFLFVVMLSGLTALKLFVICDSPLDLAPDEAHYWEWSKNLDWAYYSKGPVVALLIAASSSIFGDSELAVRFPAVVLSVLFWTLFYLALRRLSSPQVALLIVFVAASSPYFHSLGLFMTTDPPCLLFWLGALVASLLAMEKGERAYWLLVGLAAGLAVLSKYTALLIYPSLVLFLVLSAHGRRELCSRQFVGGAMIFGICLLPLVFWNWRHDWVNFAHNASHIISHEGVRFALRHPLALVASQVALVGPVLLLLLVQSAYRICRADLAGREGLGAFLLFSSFPLVALCLLVSLGKPVYANWPMPCYLGLLLALGLRLKREQRRPEGWAGLLMWGVCLNIALLVPAYALVFGVTFAVPGDYLPTKKLLGWEELGREVGSLRAGITQVAGREPFVMSDGYSETASLSFYTTGRPRVMCFNEGDRRMNHYDLRGGWEELRGRDALIVLKRAAPSDEIKSHFEEIRAVGEHLDIPYGRGTLRTFHFFHGRGFDGVSPRLPLRY